MTTRQRLGETYERQNQEAAQIIAADPERYPGVMQQWARLVLQRSSDQRPAKEWRLVA